jgi:hypothetical protein
MARGNSRAQSEALAGAKGYSGSWKDSTAKVIEKYFKKNKDSYQDERWMTEKAASSIVELLEEYPGSTYVGTSVVKETLQNGSEYYDNYLLETTIKTPNGVRRERLPLIWPNEYRASLVKVRMEEGNDNINKKKGKI